MFTSSVGEHFNCGQLIIPEDRKETQQTLRMEIKFSLQCYGKKNNCSWVEHCQGERDALSRPEVPPGKRGRKLRTRKGRVRGTSGNKHTKFLSQRMFERGELGQGRLRGKNGLRNQRILWQFNISGFVFSHNQRNIRGTHTNALRLSLQIHIGYQKFSDRFTDL